MPASPDEIVADEARRRPPAALAAVAGALLTLAAGVWNAVVLADQPRVDLLGALDERVGGHGPPVLKIRQALFFDDKGLQLIGAAVVLALGTIATAYVLTVLFRAVRERVPQISRVAIVTVMTAAVAVAVGGLVRYGVLFAESSSFAGDADRTAAGARDVIQAPAYIAGAIIEQIGRFALGVALILVALNAMKVGLLTRFVGTLGIIGGALVIVPILGGGLPVVQVVWLGMVAVLLAGRWPGGMPPAWEQGVAIPWPTQQEIREQREAAKAGREPRDEPQAEPHERERAPRAEPEHEPTSATAAPRPHAGPKKRKRKRRA